MSNSNWSVRLAIVGSGIAAVFIVWGLSAAIFHMGFSSGRYNAEAQGYAAQYASKTQERVAECFADGPSPSAQECAEQAVTASHDSQRAEQDLQAQREMAQWAKWLLIVSIAQIPLGIAGLVVLLSTLRQGRDALSRARDANRIAQSVADAELRPYFFVDKVEVIERRSLHTDELDEDGEPLPGAFSARIVVSIRNTGKVPVRNGRVYIKEYFARRYLGEFWGYRFDKIDLPICAPGHTRKVFGSIFISKSQRQDWDLGILQRFLRLRFTFEDSDGNEFSEKAAYFICGDELDTAFLITDTRVAEWRRLYAEMSERQDDLFG